MGALHQGHAFLVKESVKNCDFTVCSIFVNPTQFNDLSDLEKYPKTIEQDIDLLSKVGCDAVFIPEINEMYSPQELELKSKNIEDKSWMQGKNIDFGLLDKVMEGAFRPGHFNGVAQVVSKLFNIITPNKAFFGQKDFQQLAIIRSMTKQMGFKTEIIACPTVRETDGLAMSSRNVRLTAEERKKAPLIYETLCLIKKHTSEKTPEELVVIAKEKIASCKEMQLEYIEIADIETLQPLLKFQTNKSAVACIALKLGNVRLIDNIIIN